MYKRVMAVAMAASSISAAVAVGAQPAAATVAAGVPASQLAASISAQPGLVTAARFDLLASTAAVAVSDDVMAGFPRNGADYGVLSSGRALAVDDPNNSGSTGTSFGGGAQRGNTSFDVTVVRLDLEVPTNHNCLAFDFRFLSEEFPEYVGSRFNDAFLAESVVAELGRSTWRTSGSEIVAPDNFAYDPEGNPITVNAAGVTSMTTNEATGTTFDGATPLLTASSPVLPGPQVLFLSIFDQGDGIFDSAVLVDALRTSIADANGGCQPGVVLAGNAKPNWADWHAGDIHVHAAGDTNLDIHPQCDSELMTNATCAWRLVDNTMRRAQRFEAEWLMFTEHAPWLGFQRESSPEIYKFEQSQSQWNTIRDAIDTVSNDEIRGLMGVELGTAVPACTRVDVDMNWEVNGVFPSAHPELKFASPGHYGVYYTPEAINDSILDCNETGPNGYVDDLQAVGGFGGINHPDNADGGSPWWCYSTERTGDGELRGAEHQPQLGRFERCTVGIDQYAARSADDDQAFRTMELVSGNNMPSRSALMAFDMFLQNGFRIGAVGGGDGHTAPRKQSAADAAECGVRIATPFGPSLGECIDAGSQPGDPNHNKVGGSGRTLAYYTGDDTPGDDYDSAAIDDPVREAIHNGQTVATNGPKATAQIGGQGPGANVTLPTGDPVELRIDWSTQWKWSGDIFADDDDRNFTRSRPEDFDSVPGAGELVRTSDGLRTLPSEIVVVVAERDGCGWDRRQCALQRVEYRYRINDDGSVADGALDVRPGDGYATTTIEPPTDGYVRVELYWEEGLSARQTPDFVAVTSPIYLASDNQVSIEGSVVDQYGVPLAEAPVELCRTRPTQLCLLRTTRADGTFVPVFSGGGDWKVRAFPPSDRRELGTDTVTLDALTGAARGLIELQLDLAPGVPPYIDPSGVVRDTFGQALPDATVTLYRGDSIEGPYVPVPDGDAIMSPDNRTNPGTTGADGTFRWDVLSGWYMVAASKPGCVSEYGEPQARTPALQVPPPALNLELVLDCRPPDTAPPTISISGADFTNAEPVEFDVALSGETDHAFAACLLDGGPSVDAEGEIEGDVPMCGNERFVAAGLVEGVHELTVVAFDDHKNFANQTFEFTVDRTPPVVTIQGVTPNAIYLVGAIPAPTCTAIDTLSGLSQPCAGELVKAAGVTGVWTYTATAADRAGNAATQSVSFTVQQAPAALWASGTGTNAVSVAGQANATGLVHSEGGIQYRGNGALTGGVEHVAALDTAGQIRIAPAARQVPAGVVPQQLRNIEQWRPVLNLPTASAAPDGACTSGTWTPRPADLTGHTVLSVPCGVRVASWLFAAPITSTIIANGPIVVEGSNVAIATGDHPALISQGSAAAITVRASSANISGVHAEGPIVIEGSDVHMATGNRSSITSIGPRASVTVRGSKFTLASVFADGPVTLNGSQPRLVGADRPSIVSTNAAAAVEIRGSNTSLEGGVLTNGSVTVHGSSTVAACGIYARTIEVRGSNQTFAACPQR